MKFNEERLVSWFTNVNCMEIQELNFAKIFNMVGTTFPLEKSNYISQFICTLFKLFSIIPWTSIFDNTGPTIVSNLIICYQK